MRGYRIPEIEKIRIKKNVKKIVVQIYFYKNYHIIESVERKSFELNFLPTFLGNMTKTLHYNTFKMTEKLV